MYINESLIFLRRNPETFRSVARAHYVFFGDYTWSQIREFQVPSIMSTRATNAPKHQIPEHYGINQLKPGSI